MTFSGTSGQRVSIVSSGDFGIDCVGNAGGCIDLDGSTNNAGVLTSNVMPLGMGLYTLSFDLAGSRRQSSPTR